MVIILVQTLDWDKNILLLNLVVKMKKSLELNEILSGKNINFLIGAGASATAYKTLNILNDESNNTSLEDLLSSEEINNDNKKILYYWYFKEWILPMIEILNDEEQNSEKNKRKLRLLQLFYWNNYKFFTTWK